MYETTATFLQLTLLVRDGTRHQLMAALNHDADSTWGHCTSNVVGVLTCVLSRRIVLSLEGELGYQPVMLMMTTQPASPITGNRVSYLD